MKRHESSAAQVLVVEDDRGIQELLRFTLVCAGYRPICAGSAEDAETVLRETLPDIAVIDWMLPGQSGLSLTRRLRRDRRTSGLPIILLTARGEEADRVAGLEGGADDYVVKPFSPKELAARVHAVLRRCTPELAKGKLSVGPVELDTVSHEARVAGQRVNLTPTEFRLLRFLIANPGRVYSRQQLLDHVWGDQVYVEDRTVDIHIRRLRVALGPAGEQVIETVRGAGYKLWEPSGPPQGAR
ncbi:phosphate regulon transcriptional regulator PhoB [Accumulibacter sp.]|uniref:phosphate regulon transcriptional regulator PhoB n=1 Tax=Accumulibacter sp. TaxID=2053492 RepID=UPI0025DC5CDC|nr:phosphate regulon transcriptional regulator PhoB [Accumulibacter sp.]MCM8595995.1 phosphate regulon transcriptional regulator PhoB [Accumulibacter sp.]MCM8626621.1 phosphate regulon transcriptional regulator PhoB [Accumulibacter sp.]MDS4050145.1 phosphate regulon transcriptional regulator PhoB [Accumulibacter sp.]